MYESKPGSKLKYRRAGGSKESLKYKNDGKDRYLEVSRERRGGEQLNKAEITGLGRVTRGEGEVKMGVKIGTSRNDDE